MSILKAKLQSVFHSPDGPNQGEVEHLNKQVGTGKENMWNSIRQTVKPKKVKMKFCFHLERRIISYHLFSGVYGLL